MHLLLCWHAPSVISFSPCHFNHVTHPDRVWKPAEAPQGWDSVGGGCRRSWPSPTLVNAQVKPAPFSTASLHSCTALKHPLETHQAVQSWFVCCEEVPGHQPASPAKAYQLSQMLKGHQILKNSLANFIHQHRLCLEVSLTSTDPAPVNSPFPIVSHLFLAAIYHQQVGSSGC